MASLCEVAGEALAEGFWAEDGGPQFMRERRKMLVAGGYGEFADFVGQHGGRSARWTEPEVAAFCAVELAVIEERVAVWRIPVGTSPHADSEWEENAAALSAGLDPEHYTASVYRASSGNQCDGVFSWTRDTIPPALGFGSRTAPLEIGSTQAGTTWVHLLREKCVARWPYGSKDIALFVAAEPVAHHAL